MKTLLKMLLSKKNMPQKHQTVCGKIEVETRLVRRKEARGKGETLAVGTVPSGLWNVQVQLTATADVDVQLFDADAKEKWPEDGQAIVAWVEDPATQNGGLLGAAEGEESAGCSGAAGGVTQGAETSTPVAAAPEPREPEECTEMETSRSPSPSSIAFPPAGALAPCTLDELVEEGTLDEDAYARPQAPR